jgi:hypothetical protein
MAININDLPDGGGYLQEPGVYDCAITDQFQWWSNDGTEGRKITMEVPGGELATTVLYLTDRAMWRVKQFVKACRLSPEAEDRFEWDYLIGCRLRVTFTSREYNGKTYIDAKKFEPIPDELGTEPRRPSPETLSPADAEDNADGTETFDDLPF